MTLNEIVRVIQLREDILSYIINSNNVLPTNAKKWFIKYIKEAKYGLVGSCISECEKTKDPVMFTRMYIRQSVYAAQKLKEHITLANEL